MFAILAEDYSDAKTLVVLVKRIDGRANLTVFKKGFSGCGELRRKAASHIQDFASRGASRFIICHDSDGESPEKVRNRFRDGLTGKVDLKRLSHAIIVPVQELEAWIIADAEAIATAIPSLLIPEVRKPEAVASPKEWLISQSRAGRSRPLYDHTLSNEKVAAFLDVQKVQAKCPSFRELVEFVRST